MTRISIKFQPVLGISALIAFLLLAGCGFSPPRGTATAPTAYMEVVSDGFHTGIMADIKWINPAAESQPVFIGFGSLEWCLDEGGKFWIILKSVFWHDEGILVFSLGEYDESVEPYFRCRIPLNEAGRKALSEFIASRIDTSYSARSYLHNTVIANRALERYSLWHNCNDFVAEALYLIGFPVKNRMLRTSRSMRKDILQGIELGREKGVTAYGAGD